MIKIKCTTKIIHTRSISLPFVFIVIEFNFFFMNLIYKFRAHDVDWIYQLKLVLLILIRYICKYYIIKSICIEFIYYFNTF
jgi:hypothetical protein